MILTIRFIDLNREEVMRKRNLVIAKLMLIGNKESIIALEDSTLKCQEVIILMKYLLAIMNPND
jgi:hypothetical protein